MSSTETELSPEAAAAGQAAEIAVEHAQEEQETRDAAITAIVQSEDAAIGAEIANSNANEALGTAEAAGSAAIVAGAIAADAAETADAAHSEAQQAKSEIQILREDLFGRLDEMQALLTPPTTGDSVTEIDTGDLHEDRGSGEASAGNSGGGNSSGTNENSGNSAGGKAPVSSAGTTKKRGFNRSRRR